jgi:hypothetical protein
VHERTHMAQLVLNIAFNRKMCSEGGFLVGQKRWEKGKRGVQGLNRSRFEE